MTYIIVILALTIVDLVYLLGIYRRKNMAVSLTPETQALLETAFAAKAEAQSQDDDVERATEEVVHAEDALHAAESTLEVEKDQATEAHRDASDAAHDAIVAIAAELGFPLPE